MNQNLYNSATAHPKEGTPVEGGGLAAINKAFEDLQKRFSDLNSRDKDKTQKSVLERLAVHTIFREGLIMLFTNDIFPDDIKDIAGRVGRLILYNPDIVQFSPDRRAIAQYLGVDLARLNIKNPRTSKVYRVNERVALVLSPGFAQVALKNPPGRFLSEV